MKISILHPSRSRPQQAAATAKAWLSSAAKPENIEYILSVDVDDDKLEEYTKQDWINHPATICVNVNSTAIQAINHAAKLSSGDLIIQIAEDFNQPPFHWDEYLTAVLEGKSDYLVKTQDGIQKTLVTLPIMDRVYYERFGYIYHPAYKHMFSDQELTAVAHMMGNIIELPLKIPHNHYSTGKTPKDAVNVKADATYPVGQRVFESRLRNNFGLSEGEIVKPYKDIVWH